MKRIFKNTYKIAFIIAVVFLLFLSVINGIGGKAYAVFADSGYTNVLDDLRKDSTFKTSDYPAMQDDKYSLDVIQIAESTSGELFVYVYQPSALIKPLVATKINMSLTDDFSKYDYDDNISGDNDSTDNNTFGGNDGNGGSTGGGFGGGGGSGRSVTRDMVTTALYDLTLLNRLGVFAKYKVSNFTVSSDEVRYYNISSISRAWNGDIDDGSGTDMTINWVSFPVGKLFTVCTVDGKLNYVCEHQEIVEIKNPYCGRKRYENGFYIYKADMVESHFIAFDCNYKIDEIYSAVVEYRWRTYKSVYHLTNYTVSHSYGDLSDYTYKTLLQEEFVAGGHDDLLSEEYKYYRIQSVSDFLKENLDDDTKTAVSKCQWVLRFIETDYTFTNYGLTQTFAGTEISEVSILRLQFRVGDKVYNLGVVSGGYTGGKNPVGDGKSLWDRFIEFCKWLEKVTGVSYVIWAIIIIAVPVIVVLIVLSAVFPPVFNVVMLVLKYIGIGLLWLLKGLWWLICLPFKGIARLIKKE